MDARERHYRRLLAHLNRLLKTPAFRREARSFHAARPVGLPPMPRVRRLADYKGYTKKLSAGQLVRLNRFLKAELRFIAKWRVLPPPLELVAKSTQVRAAWAIFAGRWAVLPIFPWTTTKALLDRFRAAKETVGREHSDTSVTRRRYWLSLWLRWHGALSDDIAAIVWGRTAGLRPLRLTEVIDYDKPLSWRGEAPAKAAVRVALRRFVEREASLASTVLHPSRIEPMGRALTLLLRAGLRSNDREVRRHATALRRASLRQS